MAMTSKFTRVLNYSQNIILSSTIENVSKLGVPSLCKYRFFSTKPTADNPIPENEELNVKETFTAEQLQGEIEKLQEDLKNHKEKYMRSLAETENMRKRLMKQIEDAKVFGIQSFCKDLLEVSDVLKTAINAVPQEELTDINPHLVNLYQGLNMTESQLLKVFKKHGLVSISPEVGEKFNPHVHEAMFQVPVLMEEKQQPETVAVIQKIGFKLHERTLRPAQVGVFKGS